MKKVINCFSWVFVGVTIIVSIITQVLAYNLNGVLYAVPVFKMFNDSNEVVYKPMQLCIFITMTLWGIRMFISEKDKRNLIYGIICIAFAIGALIFYSQKDIW
ncbi:hypothetical protein IAI10_01865 [Clostridium sp. 19966]|uniref:hypothetical protein n=1 Tax=Clostridium sp. 19966 TaxID=2768166 RepID=UPI0028E09935|nr:hypothetical protein [Clostridium sp. 19966]MDT8715402.1 hypothetical protein [Clostridium sp. 19966]